MVTQEKKKLLPAPHRMQSIATSIASTTTEILSLQSLQEIRIHISDIGKLVQLLHKFNYI